MLWTLSAVEAFVSSTCKQFSDEWYDEANVASTIFAGLESIVAMLGILPSATLVASLTEEVDVASWHQHSAAQSTLRKHSLLMTQCMMIQSVPSHSDDHAHDMFASFQTMPSQWFATSPPQSQWQKMHTPALLSNCSLMRLRQSRLGNSSSHVKLSDLVKHHEAMRNHVNFLLINSVICPAQVFWWLQDLAEARIRGKAGHVKARVYDEWSHRIPVDTPTLIAQGAVFAPLLHRLVIQYVLGSKLEITWASIAGAAMSSTLFFVHRSMLPCISTRLPMTRWAISWRLPFSGDFAAIMTFWERIHSLVSIPLLPTQVLLHQQEHGICAGRQWQVRWKTELFPRFGQAGSIHEQWTISQEGVRCIPCCRLTVCICLRKTEYSISCCWKTTAHVGDL